MSRQLSEQEIRRREELTALREAGIEPYPHEWHVDTYADDVVSNYDVDKHGPSEDGTKARRVSMAGRMMSKRVMGKAAFFDLQDASGTVQIGRASWRERGGEAGGADGA